MNMNLKRLLIFGGVVLFCLNSLSAKDYYLSTTGNDRNAGTEDAPFATLEKAVSMLGAGDICYVRGGEYKPENTVSVKNSGTKDDRICLFAYENEKPVFNFEKLPYDDNARGINHKIGANYWHYKGLTFCNAGDNGMKMEGSYIVIENCTFRDNKDTGLQIGFGKGSKGENTRNPDFYFGRYIIVLNCDAYNNYDTKTSGGNADGFATKLYPGPGIEFHGCRSWGNSDDGWDFYYTFFPYIVDNCWSMNNGFDKGNGNGFKMGGGKQGETMSNGAHIFTNCISIDNKSKGFDQNNHDEGTYMINCVSARNKINYGFNMDAPSYGKWYLRNNIGFKATERNHQFNSGSEVDAEYCSWLTFDGCDKYSDRNKVPNPAKPGSTTTPKIADYTSEFKSLALEDAIADRQPDGSLPALFGRLKDGSKFIDAGVDITSFIATDVKYPAYSRTITIPYIGASADMGAFEYGIDKNDYELVMPDNDGSIPEIPPVYPEDEWTDDEGNTYKEAFYADWYPFQDAVLPDSLNFIQGGLVEPSYNLYPAEISYSNGALKLGKTEFVDFELPSLCQFQAKLYFSGTRIVTIKYKTQGQSTWTESSVSKSKGAHVIDLAAMTMKTKSPITVRIENTRTDGGDMRISELLVSGYKKDGSGNSINNGYADELDIYQTETAMIVYGEVASLRVYNMLGGMVSNSTQMQVVDTSHLPKGVYILSIEMKDGQKASKKFVKK